MLYRQNITGGYITRQNVILPSNHESDSEGSQGFTKKNKSWLNL